MKKIVSVLFLLLAVGTASAQVGPPSTQKANFISYTSYGVTVSQLYTVPPQFDGTIVWVRDAAQGGDTCVGGGPGTWASHTNGSWHCNALNGCPLVGSTEIGTQVTSMIAANNANGGIVDLRACAGATLTLSTPILIDRPTELYFAGNVTATTPAPANIASATTSCSVGCISTFNLTGGLPATWLVANKSVVHVLGASNAVYNGEWTPISVSGCNGGSPNLCTKFSAYINASSKPADLGASGKVIMAPIEVAGATSLNGSGVIATAGSGTRLFGIGGGATENGSSNIGQAGLAVTGNPQALIINDSSGLGDGIAIAHWAHDVTVEGMNIVGANQFVQDGIVSGAVNNTNRYIHNTISFPTGTFDGTHFTFGGIVPVGDCIHLDGMINDQGRIEDNGCYGWANGIFVDAGTTGTQGEIAGPIVEHNWLFYLTGAFGIDVEGTSAGHVNDNIIAQSALAASASDLLIDGSTGFQTYNLTAIGNQFEGDNSLGNTGIVQVRTIGTVAGCTIVDDTLTGNTTDSLAAHDPDHNIDLSTGTTNCLVAGNTLSHASAGGIVSQGKNIAYFNNGWSGGHGVTTLNGQQTFPEATVTVNVPSPVWPVLTTYYLTIPTVSTNGTQVVTCTGHASPAATTFTSCTGGVGTIPDTSAVLEGAAVVPTSGVSSLVSTWFTGPSASMSVECSSTNPCVYISGDNGAPILDLTNNISNPQTEFKFVPDNIGDVSINAGGTTSLEWFADAHILVPTYINRRADAYSTFYSAAGTPVPTCNSGANHQRVCVSDSTACTNGTTYVSGGAVACVLNCNSTNWLETGGGCY